jgi:hypothetical protein
MLLPCSANDVAYRDTYDGSVVFLSLLSFPQSIHANMSYSTVEEWARRWQGFDIPETAFSGLGGGPALAFPGRLAISVTYDLIF